MTRAVKLGVVLVAALVAFGCGKEKAKQEEAPAAETTAQEQAKGPDYISVQHILIGFQGSLPGKPVSRTKEEAEQLANEIFAKAKAGEDFDALVKEYTDDAYPGIYKMANFGVPADRANMVYPREGMVPAFGNVGFPLAVGEIGMAAYNPQESPYGWHIIKRVE